MKIYLERLPETLREQAPAVRACLERFAQVLKVKEVLLFGSFARGEAGADSDVDLCIVAEGAERQLETARLLRRAIRDVRPKPAFTLIPITPGRLEEKRRTGDHFFRTVLVEGVLLGAEE